MDQTCNYYSFITRQYLETNSFCAGFVSIKVVKGEHNYGKNLAVNTAICGFFPSHPPNELAACFGLKQTQPQLENLCIA